MNDGNQNYIIEKNLTYAWGEALSLLLERGRKEIHPLIVSVKNFNQNAPAEDLQIRDELDKLLISRKKYNSHTVANTIFPKSLWSPDKERDLLYKRFRGIFQQILTYDKIGKRYGRYFDRMIDYGRRGASSREINQLEYILSTIEKGNKRRSAYQVSIIDPLIDHTDQPMRGFPCLQQIAFSPLEGGGLSVTGFYPYQYIFDRAYGNYLGLCWLGHFMAHELGLELKEMTCVSGIAKLGRINKTDSNLLRIRDLIKKRKKIMKTSSSEKCKSISEEYKNIHSFIKRSLVKTTIVYDTYWKFAAERQSIFFRRYNGEKPLWTTDPVLKKHKFTNAYRATDRVSQYLIKNVIYGDDNQSVEEIFFRIILFKLFNKIETWQLISNEIGTASYRSYTFNEYDKILTRAMAEGRRIFSGAYIMPSGSSTWGHKKKHRNCLKLLEKMMADMLPLKLTKLKRMQDAFELIRSYPMMGDFLAYQFVTDINYSELTNFSEMEFVVPGPGAKNGLRKCFSDFGGLNEEELIKLMADNQEKEFDRLGLKFETLWGRGLQLIDCQNLFCEVDKYSRIVHPEIITVKNSRTRIKQLFRPNMGKIDYWFPPKWKLNEKAHNDK